MTVRSDDVLPTLVAKCHQALEQEAAALKGHVERCANDPQPDAVFTTDQAAWKSTPNHRHRAGRRRMMQHGLKQARLLHVAAFDHLVTLRRVLGEDGALPIYAHATLSRSACEAAVRLSWHLDATVDYEIRVARSAVALHDSALNQLKGAQHTPRTLPTQLRSRLIENAQAEHDRVMKLIDSAGMARIPDARGKRTAWIELSDSGTRIPVKLDIGPLMDQLLPDSPGWYNLSSGVAHSATWMLRDAVVSGEDELYVRLQPNLLDIAAAVQSAISASALIIETYARYYGYDPDPIAERSRQRRRMLDPWITDYVAAQHTQSAKSPRVPPARQQAEVLARLRKG